MRPASRIDLDYKPQAGLKTRAHARWFLCGLGISLVVGLIAYLVTKEPSRGAAASVIPAQIATLPQLKIQDVPVAALPQRAGSTIQFVVRRNDTMDRIFRQLKFSLNDLATIRELPQARSTLDQLQPGDTITLVHQEGMLNELSHRISQTEVLLVTRGENGFAAKVLTTPLNIRTARATGVINSSLFVAARAAGVSSDIILRMANDIFGWDIDFALEIQPGDRFSVVYEQKYRGTEYVGDGMILAAEFVNAGKTHRAIHYASKDGQISDYFAPDGRSMRRQFLRAPLDFTRISSNFDPARRHPILNTIRAHKGVDYAAQTGTVIKAAGDGRVDFVGMKGGYGRVVILEHGGGVSTLYGHMSRFASGLRVGQRVKQGVTIGFVGSSGAATGPHLHYEYRLNGVHQNPRTVPLPDASPIPAGYMAEFQSVSGTLLADLDRVHDTAIAVVAE